jgi:hypothetical protein
MDLSKLPRMSHTPSAPPPDPAETVPQPVPPDAAFPVIVPAQTAEPPQVHCNRCGAANSAGSRFCNGCGAELRAPQAISYAAPVDGPGIGAEVWLSAIIGVALMLYGRGFLLWALTSMTGGTFHTTVSWTTGPNQGQEVGYWQLEGSTALQETAIFLFGFAMVLEALVLAVIHSRIRSKRPLLWLALTITLLATALNLVVAGKLFTIGVLPFLSLLAVGFGGYIGAYEWKLLKYFRPVPR